MKARFALPALFIAATVLLPAWSALARQPPEPVEDVARSFLAAETAGLPGQVEVSVGTLDAANQLPPCTALEAFLPSGTRAWGQLSVGIRCVAPAAWTVYLPARVAVMTDFLVAARPIRPGQIVGPDDIALRHGDLAAQPATALTDPSRAIGAHVRIAVAEGNTLRADMLRLPPAVRAGQSVRVIGSGPGFTVSNEGRALNRAAEGEAVRVRLNNGQVVDGTARSDGTVEVRF